MEFINSLFKRTLSFKPRSLFDGNTQKVLVYKTLGLKCDEIIRVEIHSPDNFIVIYRSLHTMAQREYFDSPQIVKLLIDCILDSNPDVRLSHTGRSM